MTLPSGSASTNDAASESQRMLVVIRELRETIYRLWQERGVMLTEDERVELAEEIRATCLVLSELAKND